MAAPEDAEARVESILEKIDREVARRRAQQQQDAAQESAPPRPPAAPPAVDEPALPADAEAAPPHAVKPVRSAVLSPEPSRPISLADPDAPVPMTPQELASGLAAARRRLAIVNTQLDELAGEIASLNDQARRLREDRLAQSGRPVLSPPPASLAEPARPADEPPAAPAMPGAASLPAAAATIPAPEPVAAPLGAPEPVPLPPAPPPPFAEATPGDGPTPARGPQRAPAGMRVRPRPPAQSQRRLPVADQARLVAVELAVSGQTRGDVADLLQAQYAEVDSQAILDSLFGPGTLPSARMSGT